MQDGNILGDPDGTPCSLAKFSSKTIYQLYLSLLRIVPLLLAKPKFV